ncbi:MAG TPA: hypothetical protein VJH95_04465 [Candidatus Nanoarchaeia archaeon]|nr:hypothetical protein [Candidatus Nanoarchaeia archaeon]
MNKKGIFFTFITVLLILVILSAYLIKTSYSPTASIQKSRAKVIAINAFVKSFDSIIERALQASSKQTIISSLDYISTSAPKAYIPSFKAEFPGIIYTGKYNGQDLIKMEDTNPKSMNLRNTLHMVQGISKDSNIYLTYSPVTLQDITIQHLSPWEIEVALTLKNIVVSDSSELSETEVSWNLGDRTIRTKLYITDYPDPLTLKENGEELTIRKSTITEFNQKTDLDKFIAEQSFLAHGDGPNFLQRISGEFTNDINGIERVLDGKRGNDPTPTDSFVDFYYWGSFNDGQSSCDVEGYHPRIRLDNKHKVYYTTAPCQP